MDNNSVRFNIENGSLINVTICNTDESLYTCDENGVELWWFGSIPTDLVPNPSIFLNSVLKNKLRDFSPPWAAIINNKKINKVWIVTDYLGLFHLFYYKNKNCVIIGANALTIAKKVSSNIDPIGIYEMIFRGNPQRGHTLFEEIKCLSPAVLIEIGKTIKKDNYWQIPNYTPVKVEDAIKLFIDAVRLSVKKQWNENDVQELTAGRDTMMLLSTYMYLGIPIKTWTHGFHYSKDLIGANDRAKRFNIKHQVIQREQISQLSIDQIFNYAQIFLNASSGMANIFEYWHLAPVLEKVDGKGTITGVGGEVFRGFYYQWAGKGFLPKSVARKLLHHGKIMEMMPIANSILKKDICRQMNSEIENEIDNALNFTNDYWYNLDAYYLKNRMHYFAGTTFSATNHWINVRMPLFDPVVIDCLPLIPTKIKKWGNGLSKIVTENNLNNFNNSNDLKLSNEVFNERLVKLKNRVIHESKGTYFQNDTIIRKMIQDKNIHNLLEYSDMLTADIYNKQKFIKLINNIDLGSSIPLFIGAIMTAELSARQVMNLNKVIKKF